MRVGGVLSVCGVYACCGLGAGVGWCHGVVCACWWFLDSVMMVISCLSRSALGV